MVTKKQRRRQLAREKWERQQSRRVEQHRRRKRRAKVAGVVVGVVAVAALVFGVTQAVRAGTIPPGERADRADQRTEESVGSTRIGPQNGNDSRFEITYGDVSKFDGLATGSGYAGSG